MKSLFYALVLLAVIAGSLILLRSFESPPSGDEPVSPRIAADRRLPLEATVSPDSVPADRLLDTGEELLESWHPREAMRMFERLVAVDSTRYRGWVRLVECYSHPLVGREDMARDAWRNARRHAPSERDTTFLAGIHDLFLESDYPSAVENFTTAAGFASTAADIDFYLARSNYLCGRLEDAQAQLARLLGADPGDGRAADLSVRVMVASGDLDGAARRGRDLAREHAAEPFPYVLLAQVEMLRGETAAAVEFCNNALVLDSRYVPAIVTRATIYVHSDQPEPARVSFEKLLLFDDPILRGIGRAGLAFVDFHRGEFGRGMDAMDEAIRDAIMAGAVRRGLSYASSLVAYLCEMGQADRAEQVVERWISGFGDIPVQLGSLRIQILRGDLDAARRSLAGIEASRDWQGWARVLAVDSTELAALIRIASGDHAGALSLLAGDDTIAPVGAGEAARRAFARGYAAFESGDAESAAEAFSNVRAHLYGVEFPYYGDPVLDVQSLFFMAETAIAAGGESEARAGYSAFLRYWGDASWDLQAVVRARDKLSGLQP